MTNIWKYIVYFHTFAKLFGNNCTILARWSEWSDWGECSEDTASRTRSCVNELGIDQHGDECVGDAEESCAC